MVSADTLTDQEFANEFETWHKEKDDAVNAPLGFLSIVSIDWLEDGVERRLDNFPGTWLAEGNTVTYTPEDGSIVKINLLKLSSPRIFTVPGDEDANVVKIDFGDLQAELIKRVGGLNKYAVRVRDPNSPLRRNFRSTPYYAPSRAWVVPASYKPFDRSYTETVGASMANLQHIEKVVGELTVTIDGKDYALKVFQANTHGQGLVIFRDATSGKETYGGGRILRFPITDPAKVTEIDFNRATHYFCAYTDFCTCEMPPLENTLPAAVTAGDKIPYERL
ncbi:MULTISPECIES: DUF1684 domain-containing protein [Bifidobacterium]|uniref:DUF1684 domain-containing protein n=1 Tax=Bifidobacterium TaxID=1678 RepID=UPI001BDD2ADD|nr:MULTISPECIES: DUF1684 domain-containing protein [Bifidobacterium]MBT1160672.1 DUF1684 domain-containing protein [Bifidobacterium sp. SO1]MBW3079490.1 DUF1684 domain-containing protein [Bifidobacterium simiiventris]